MYKDNNINENKKTIWIVSHYSAPPEYETRVKTLKYAEYLIKHGFKVLLFTASTVHNTQINLVTKREKYIKKKYGDLEYVHIYCHNYANNGIKRILNMQEFVYKFRRYAVKFDQPDIVLAADMNCTNYSPIFRYCKKRKIPFIIDIRDLWPESIVEYLGFSKKNPIIKYLYQKERRMYKKADYVVFSQEGGKDYIIEKGWQNEIDLNKIKYINNGVDLKYFYSCIENYQIDDPDLNSSEFKLIYTGSIRKVNGVYIIIEAARYFKKHEFPMKFIIYGDGTEKFELEDIAEREGLNIKFKGTVDKKFIPYILSKADCTIITCRKSNIFRFGGSLNKLFDYMAAGKPIVSNLEMSYNPIVENNIGRVGSNVSEFINACIYYSNRDNSDIEKVARKVVKEYDFDNLCEKLLFLINDLV